MPSPAHSRTPEVRVRRVRDRDLQARVSTIDAPGERAFVLVAGIGVAANYFENLAPVLGEFGPVHALDLPGFAGVRRPRAPISMERYSEVLEAAIDQLGLVDPVLIGHSMGTQVVASLAARRPDLTSIVLIGPVVDMRARRIPVQLLRFVRSSVHEPIAVALLASSAYLLCGVGWFMQVMPKMMRFPTEKVVQRIEGHVLVIRGEYDYVSPRGWVEHLVKVAKHGSSWEIEGAAHSVMHAYAAGVARLAVEHAREPLDEKVESGLQRVAREDAVTPPPTRWTLRMVVGAVAARVRELRASADDDIEEIQEAKTDHARIQHEAYEK